MNKTVYVVANKERGPFKIAKTKPLTKRGEISFKVKFDIPDELFDRFLSQEVQVKLSDNLFKEEPEIHSTIEQIEL